MLSAATSPWSFLFLSDDGHFHILALADARWPSEMTALQKVQTPLQKKVLLNIDDGVWCALMLADTDQNCKIKQTELERILTPNKTVERSPSLFCSPTAEAKSTPGLEEDVFANMGRDDANETASKSSVVNCCEFHRKISKVLLQEEKRYASMIKAIEKYVDTHSYAVIDHIRELTEEIAKALSPKDHETSAQCSNSDSDSSLDHYYKGVDLDSVYTGNSPKKLGRRLARVIVGTKNLHSKVFDPKRAGKRSKVNQKRLEIFYGQVKKQFPNDRRALQLARKGACKASYEAASKFKRSLTQVSMNQAPAGKGDEQQQLQPYVSTDLSQRESSESSDL